ncbi:hypothetical protein [Lactobacillus amylolyticus]|uniref:hypothetical protein n=1 Tax=Lactobacillus amylolyticus TaxID=83683 RepID=UPI00248F718F|nr:hypothetical protein [Lactobacillus amylolyticus]
MMKTNYETYDKLVDNLLRNIHSGVKWGQSISKYGDDSGIGGLSDVTKELDFPIPEVIFDSKSPIYRKDYVNESNAFLLLLKNLSVKYPLGISFSASIEELGEKKEKRGSQTPVRRYLVGHVTYPVSIKEKALKEAINKESEKVLNKFCKG